MDAQYIEMYIFTYISIHVCIYRYLYYIYYVYDIPNQFILETSSLKRENGQTTTQLDLKRMTFHPYDDGYAMQQCLKHEVSETPKTASS